MSPKPINTLGGHIFHDFLTTTFDPADTSKTTRRFNQLISQNFNPFSKLNFKRSTRWMLNNRHHQALVQWRRHQDRDHHLQAWWTKSVWLVDLPWLLLPSFTLLMWSRSVRKCSSQILETMCDDGSRRSSTNSCDKSFSHHMFVTLNIPTDTHSNLYYVR